MNKYDLKDTFFKKAKKEGYRARSIYKLKEIQERFGIIKKGDRVLDLGCSPGSFLQYISEVVGEKGLVIGIDILPTPPLNKKNIITFQGDIKTTDIRMILASSSISYFDVVTCDIAPNLTGIRETDDRNMEEIFFSVKNIVGNALKKNGSFILKSFFSETFKPIQEDLKTMFKKVTIYKPQASRSKSSEIYLICLGKIRDP
ncbi:MAG TPA: RlmE family RNA methyltransferase [Syntrophorhabdaceae bacterium]|nr:RlmE family RNA methyltransferase [Syntrophorhabdaceae bacterium]HPP06083.1 RlmE family RNA methyltransferase [Syntrophorhabdaceae bacterium]